MAALLTVGVCGQGVYGGQRASVDMDQIVLRSLSIHGLVGSPGTC